MFHLTRSHSSDSVLQLLKNLPIELNLVLRDMSNHDSESQVPQVMFMFEAFVGSQKHVETALNSLDQNLVCEVLPAEIPQRTHCVVGK